MNKRKMEAKCSTRYIRTQEWLQNGGRVGRTKRLLETLTEEKEKKSLNLSGMPRTLKIGNPHKVLFLSFYSTRREDRLQKSATKYPLSINGDISLDFRGG